MWATSERRSVPAPWPLIPGCQAISGHHRENSTVACCAPHDAWLLHMPIIPQSCPWVCRCSVGWRWWPWTLHVMCQTRESYTLNVHTSTARENRTAEYTPEAEVQYETWACLNAASISVATAAISAQTA